MLSKMQTVAQRQKRNTLRDAIVGAAIVLLVGIEAVAFSQSSRDTLQGMAVDEPIQTQVDSPIDPEQMICTPESVAVVC